MVAAIRPLVALVGGRALFALDAAAQVPIVEIALLRSLRIVRALPALEGLARSMDPMRLAAGEVLIREGEPGDRFYAVADGRLRVTIGGAPAASNVRGNGIGEIALLYGVPRTATVTAISPATVFTLSREDFLAAVAGHPPTARAAATADERLDQDRRYQPSKPDDPARQGLAITHARAILRLADTPRALGGRSPQPDRIAIVGSSSDDQHLV